VYRLDGLYVVPYHDELGIDRQPEFADASEARRFREGVKFARLAKTHKPWVAGGDDEPPW
jgi:hypothetical protein